MRSSRQRHGVEGLRRLVDAGLGVEEFRAESLQRLRSFVTISAAFYASVDTETLLVTSAVTEEPLAAAAARFLDNEYGAQDVNKFATLVDGADSVGSLDHATGGDRGSSPRYRDLMATMGLGDEARAVLRSRGRCWGVLCLHREDAANGFDEDELALLRDIAPLLGEGLRRGLAVSGTAMGDAVGGGPGVLILDAGLSVVSSNSQAGRWLGEVDESEWPPSLPLPLAVMSTAAAAAEHNDGEPPPGRTRVRRAGGGWMTVNASRLSGTSQTVVVLDSADPEELTSLVLAAHGLTPAQGRVAALVLRGRSTQEIVNEVGISQHTVQEHLSSVFEKFGVGSRRELVAVLSARPR